MELAGPLGFLGYGNMGSAILAGLLEHGKLAAENLLIYDVDPAKAAAASDLGVQVAASAEDLARRCATLVLAVKPQTMAEALDQLEPGMSPEKLVISIAAGISIDYLQGRLGTAVRVIRVMPNTPALVSAGAAGIALSPNCTEKDAELAREIFGAVGIAETVPEPAIDAVTALSGSGPAYFFYMVECLIKAATAQGLPEHVATRLAGQTLLGAGRLLAESGEPAAILRERVTSKGGTTEAALKQFAADGFERVVAAAVDAAAARSRELGK
ncbi:MAG TPA: pyrroline-5-carboxylate reductase [Candidatus Hydrogenedentes bacterium]|nr:pyrroline-5-carboxylate reductase [Candidatus Hydrogenedentota bacterium]